MKSNKLVPCLNLRLSYRLLGAVADSGIRLGLVGHVDHVDPLDVVVELGDDGEPLVVGDILGHVVAHVVVVDLVCSMIILT